MLTFIHMQMPRHKIVMAVKPKTQHNVDHISLPLSAAASKNTWLSSMHLAALTPFKYDFLCNRLTHLQCANRCAWQRGIRFCHEERDIKRRFSCAPTMQRSIALVIGTWRCPRPSWLSMSFEFENLLPRGETDFERGTEKWDHMGLRGSFTREMKIKRPLNWP